MHGRREGSPTEEAGNSGGGNGTVKVQRLERTQYEGGPVGSSTRPGLGRGHRGPGNPVKAFDLYEEL